MMTRVLSAERIKRLMIQKMTPTRGRIILVTGPMYSGKSSTLLRYVERTEAIYQKAIVISPRVDTRSDTGLVCHSGKRRDAMKLDSLLSLDCSDQSFLSSHLIAIDEAQFFEADDLMQFVRLAVETHNKTVVVAGLDNDYKRHPFRSILQLFPFSDEIIKLSALCSICKDTTHALFTLRTPADTSDILVGSTDHYQSVCRYHYCMSVVGKTTKVN